MKLNTISEWNQISYHTVVCVASLSFYPFGHPKWRVIQRSASIIYFLIREIDCPIDSLSPISIISFNRSLSPYCWAFVCLMSCFRMRRLWLLFRDRERGYYCYLSKIVRLDLFLWDLISLSLLRFIFWIKSNRRWINSCECSQWRLFVFVNKKSICACKKIFINICGCSLLNRLYFICGQMREP